jgi:hypothetical protein
MLLLAKAAAITSAGAEPITEANWLHHPAIVEIRTIYQEIKDAEKAGRLRKEERTFGYCRPYEDTDRALSLDADGAVRSYYRAAGSEDSAIKAYYYYDRDGALRFVLAEAGAVNDTRYEYRIYLSKTGERLWQAQRLLKGPGYTFPSELPDEWLVRHPKQAFEATPPACD